MNDARLYLHQAIELARQNIAEGGRPFGAVVVRDEQVIATGVNEIHRSHDVTDHAELLAIRAAARGHGPEALHGSTVYASGHPCPMCLAAMRIAGVASVVYAYSNEDGEPYNLSTAQVYEDLRKPLAEQSMQIRHQPMHDPADQGLYEQWALHSNPTRA